MNTKQEHVMLRVSNIVVPNPDFVSTGMIDKLTCMECNHNYKYHEYKHWYPDGLNCDVLEHQKGSNILAEIQVEEFATHIVNAIEDRNSMYLLRLYGSLIPADLYCPCIRFLNYNACI